MANKKKSSSTRVKGPGPLQDRQPYERGDKTPTGTTITKIIEQTSDYIIYINQDDALCWIINRTPDWIRPALAECVELLSETLANVSLKYNFQIQQQLGAALAIAFKTSKEGDYVTPFAAVRTFIEEKKKEIREVYSDGPGFVVYLKSNDSVEWWYENLPDHLKPAVSEFERLQILSQINLPKNYHKHVSGQLAWAVTGAFRGGEVYNFKPAFAKVEQFIESRTMANARFAYVMASIYTAAIGIIFTLSLYVFDLLGDSTVMQFTLGGCFGMIGALLSILQRGRHLTLDPLAPRRNVIMQSATRLLIGILSGTIIIMAAKSELALGLVANNNFALMLFAVISGFTERYVPDLMENISSSTKTAPEEKSEEE